jgi:hypothetical protein
MGTPKCVWTSSIHPSFFGEKAGSGQGQTKKKKRKEADMYFCTACNEDSLLKYLMSSGPREEIGMY